MAHNACALRLSNCVRPILTGTYLLHSVLQLMSCSVSTFLAIAVFLKEWSLHSPCMLQRVELADGGTDSGTLHNGWQRMKPHITRW